MLQPNEKLERKIVITEGITAVMFQQESICYLIAFHEDRGAGAFFFFVLTALSSNSRFPKWEMYPPSTALATKAHCIFQSPVPSNKT